MTTRPDHASPWVLDTRTLGRRPGSMRPVQVQVPVLEPIGLDVLAVPPGADVELDLRLESVAEGVLVSGIARAEAVGECARCLGELTVPVTATIRELFAYPGSTTAETTDEDEIGRVVDDLVDLEQTVRDEMVLALPLAPLCRPDCPGLCSECGEPLADLDANHSHEILDPRWDALRSRFGAADGPDPEGDPGADPGHRADPA
ncbi:YceD family protein [Nakamurella leprariae]|uniref:DUF177 domain-containing protein n=1 Tax=Nakamurella leprariae TaxID=2803911 RepID=A0A938YJR1_9ACTN|nr:YceD family protein [Nakamurella leprariae]MBM9469552.1 DUF177 domain-containing protein [Nakamurella leprariae]